MFRVPTPTGATNNDHASTLRNIDSRATNDHHASTSDNIDANDNTPVIIESPPQGYTLVIPQTPPHDSTLVITSTPPCYSTPLITPTPPHDFTTVINQTPDVSPQIHGSPHQESPRQDTPQPKARGIRMRGLPDPVAILNDKQKPKRKVPFTFPTGHMAKNKDADNVIDESG